MLCFPAIYLMYFMSATAASVIASAIVIKIHYNDHEMAPPQWLTVLTFDLIAPLFCLKSVVSWSRYHRKCKHRSQKHVTNSNGVVANKSHVMSRSLSITQSDLHEDVIDDKAIGVQCALSNCQYVTEKWKKISEVMDRLFFWMFLGFLVIPLVSLIGFLYAFKATSQH